MDKEKMELVREYVHKVTGQHFLRYGIGGHIIQIYSVDDHSGESDTLVNQKLLDQMYDLVDERYEEA